MRDKQKLWLCVPLVDALGEHQWAHRKNVLVVFGDRGQV